MMQTTPASPTRILLAAAALAVLAVAAPRIAAAQNPHGNSDLDCATCHDETSWRVPDRPPGFDHARTGFVLAGGHATVGCRECHRDLVFAHIGTSCVDCHEDMHRGRLGPDCAGCHTVDGWNDREAMRRLHDSTLLPLVGAHERADCEACHRDAVSADYVGTPTDCYACHREQYAATADPPHAASGLGTDCATCHGVFAATWGGADFRHSTTFPLTGGHGGLACAACHDDGFTGAPTDCYACHGDDYDGTTDPQHVAAGFGTDCALCHRVASGTWNESFFRHPATFPLTGGHAGRTCLDCHAGGYAGTPTDCYACHQADYDGTTDPQHVAAGFPTDCAACHTTAAWEPSTWDHDALFPIFSGRHRDAWTSCADCHDVPTDYAAFECILCHTHNRTDTDAHHGEVGGYQYLSAACYECHPRGVGGD